MPLGTIAAIVLVVGLATWGFALWLRGRAQERASEASSHNESEAGYLGSQDSTPHND